MEQLRKRARGKKLTDAVRLIETGRGATGAASARELSGFAEDLRLFGAPEEEIARAEALARQAPEGDDGRLSIHWSNVVAVKWYLALRTQWRVTSISSLAGSRLVNTGLDYGAARETALLAGLTVEAEDFDKLRLLEAEAISIFTERLVEGLRRS